jgi:type II secretory pathway pseudopilin PulG
MNEILRGGHAARLSVSAARRDSLAGRANASGPPVLPGIRTAGAFTIIELLVVIAIIIVLAALVLGTVGYVQKKGARSRAEAEIAALSAALESFKADNGAYPTDKTLTEQVDPTVVPVPPAASLYLYEQLSGDTSATLQPPAAGVKSYFTFKPQMLSGPKDLSGNLTAVNYIRDPFGNPYGYSTMKAANPAGTAGYNPTFDLWSTANANPPADQNQWVKNW